ncbi:MAG: L-histidine N(alpha)-methyltransferase [Flavobacteriaceae bacterium]|nr:MAG: L-histidine N(alpha)-methyltransferase [Flavobacteriaceae bacterium]
MIEQFKKEVDTGLSIPKKTLPSKYFYDKKGGALFVEIMHSKEYYLTRAELEIFTNQTQNIIDALELKRDTYFELIELGAGDGLKTKQLLKELSKQNYTFDYIPIDISQNALDDLEQTLTKEITTLSINKKQGDYFDVLESIKGNKHPKVILFLGSNMGNMSDKIASKFITNLSHNLNPNDKLFLGVDLIKPKEIVLPAYNDSKGITKAFNLNLLERINKELGGNFVVNNFGHQPEYSEKEGVCKSYLVSYIEQKVFIQALNKTFHFEKGEKILTEISRKYNDAIIQKIIDKSYFKVVNKLTDTNNYFANISLTRT